MRPRTGWPPTDDQGAPLPASSLVTSLTDAAGRIQMDPVVVRGYLGRHPLHAWVEAQRDKIEEALKNQGGARPEVPEGFQTWRIYLSPRFDRYVQFTERDVVAYARESDPDEEDVYTVWLKNDQEYMVTTLEPLRAPNGFLRGDLLEDYLGRPQSRQVAWDGQDYAMPTAGGQSKVPCSGY